MRLSINEYCEFPLNGMWTPNEEILGLTAMTKITEFPNPLYMGGTVDGYDVPLEVEHLITLNRLSAYSGGSHLKTYTSINMYDIEGEAIDADLVQRLACWVNSCLTDGPTAVICYAGLNRSGLITGAALIQQGISPSNAVRLLRNRRNKAVLYNKTFEEFLLNYEES